MLEITMLSAEEGSEPVPQDRLRDEQRDDGAPLRLVDESCMSDRSTDKGRSYPAKHTPYRLRWPESGAYTS